MDKWEIARDRIVLKESIGHGAFGAVWRARLSHPDGELEIQTVAVKCFTRKTHLISLKCIYKTNSNIPIMLWCFHILQPLLERKEEKL